MKHLRGRAGWHGGPVAPARASWSLTATARRASPSPGRARFNGPLGAWRNTSRSVREDSLWPASSEPVNSLQHYLHTYGTVLRVLNFVLLHDSTPEGRRWGRTPHLAVSTRRQVAPLCRVSPRHVVPPCERDFDVASHVTQERPRLSGFLFDRSSSRLRRCGDRLESGFDIVANGRRRFGGLKALGAVTVRVD